MDSGRVAEAPETEYPKKSAGFRFRPTFIIVFIGIAGPGILVLWLVASNRAAQAPNWARLKPQPMESDLRTLPIPALKTVINVDWIIRFVDIFHFAEGRVPATYAQLTSSEYFPSRSALINPYTRLPVEAAAQPPPGDIRWEVGSSEDPEGNPLEGVKVSYTITKAKGQPPVEQSVGAVYRRNRAIPGRDQVLQWVRALSPLERRTYWVCWSLYYQLKSDFTGFLGGDIPRTFRQVRSLLGWRYPAGVLPNPWAQRPMRPVPATAPAPGDFTYITLVGPDGKPGDIDIVCYGDDGRVIFPMYKATPKPSTSPRF